MQPHRTAAVVPFAEAISRKGGIDAAPWVTERSVACLQAHDGGHLLALLRELRLPVVTMLHTVLRETEPPRVQVAGSTAKPGGAAQPARIVVETYGTCH